MFFRNEEGKLADSGVSDVCERWWKVVSTFSLKSTPKAVNEAVFFRSNKKNKDLGRKDGLGLWSQRCFLLDSKPRS